MGSQHEGKRLSSIAQAQDFRATISGSLYSATEAESLGLQVSDAQPDDPTYPSFDPPKTSRTKVAHKRDWTGLRDCSSVSRVNLTRPSDRDNELVKVAALHGPAGILAVLRKNKDRVAGGGPHRE